MRKYLVAIFGMALAACSLAPQLRLSAGPDSGMLYGYFDMSGAGSTLEKVAIGQDERAGLGYRYSNIDAGDNGVFFVYNLPAQKYIVAYLYANHTIYDLKSDASQMIELHSGEIKFVGAYRYVKGKKGIISPDQFEMHELQHPSSREVLAKVLAQVRDPEWRQRILAVLNNNK